MSQSPDPFEFMKSLWAPMGLPGVMAPTLDVGEIDRRIAELKSVENWLNMNLAALRMTIQGLEMQRATLAAMQGGAQPKGSSGGLDAGEAGRRFAEAWLKMLQQTPSAGSKSSSTAPSAGPGKDTEPGKK